MGNVRPVIEKNTSVSHNKGLCVCEGHSAKYGSYTMMDLETNTVVDVQHVQVREQKHLWQHEGRLEFLFICFTQKLIVLHFFARAMKLQVVITW